MIRLAMWSGPRNLSTAMMYAFYNRADCTAIDEPFYASYLHKTGKNHPMRDEILASQPKDPNTVIEGLTGPVSGDFHLYYQKHMVQHMIEGIPRDWFPKVKHIMLIRHPARVIASFGAKYPNLQSEDIGFAVQKQLYDDITMRTGAAPAVFDSADILQNPVGYLTEMCACAGVDFEPAMLAWKAGKRDIDGVWATHWYQSVHASTGFAQGEKPLPKIENVDAELYDEAMSSYSYLSSRKIVL